MNHNKNSRYNVQKFKLLQKIDFKLHVLKVQVQ